jgi:hypothetical protein
MSRHLKWTDRKFDFTFPVEVYPEMIERLRGTPARLEDRVKSIAPENLTRRDVERWSIQENAGHLLDLESLVSGQCFGSIGSSIFIAPGGCEKTKNDPRNHTKRHEKVLVRVISCVSWIVLISPIMIRS